MPLYIFEKHCNIKPSVSINITYYDLSRNFFSSRKTTILDSLPCHSFHFFDLCYYKLQVKSTSMTGEWYIHNFYTHSKPDPCNPPSGCLAGRVNLKINFSPTEHWFIMCESFWQQESILAYHWNESAAWTPVISCNCPSYNRFSVCLSVCVHVYEEWL